MDNRRAFKMQIRDVIERPISRMDDGPYFIEYDGSEITTVRVMGVVVSEYEAERYNILTIDDSTETISVRMFEEDKSMAEDIRTGDTVDVVATLRSYEDETYLQPCVITKITDPNWELVRRLELTIQGKKGGSKSMMEEVVREEEVLEDDLKTLLKDVIIRLDEGDGAQYNSIVKESGLGEEVVEKILNELLGESEIYEPKIGKFKKV